ncbi:MAG TPA: hypothetical protein VH417_03930 [Vicinamibacterales bacterium]|jgi:hypothetical protein
MNGTSLARFVMLPWCLVGGLAVVAAAQTDPRIGTWELNLGKSTFSPGPPPQRQTLWYKVEGQQMIALLQGVDAQGHPITPDPGNFTIYLDGKDHPTPRPGYDTSNWKRINANKYVVYRKKAGKTVLTSTNVVSEDGHTLTITTTGTDENGRSVSNVRVYDKRPQ